MPLAIICDSPPTAFVDEAYSHAFPASGGTEPYTFDISIGTLPAGLTLNAGTGVVSGTPTTKGTSTFTIRVTDAVDATASVECSILVRSKCLVEGTDLR